MNEANSLCLILGPIISLSAAGSTALTPYWTRPDILFSVTVNPQLRQMPEGRSLLRGFRWMVMCIGVVGLLLMLAGALPSVNTAGSSALLAVGLLVQVVGLTAVWLHFRRKTTPFRVTPSARREVLLQPRRAHVPGGGAAQLGPFLLLAAAAGYLCLRWNDIPDRFPVHWGLDGRPNGWTNRSIGGVFFGPILGFLVCGLMVWIFRAVARGVPRAHVSPAEVAQEDRRQRMLFWMGLLVEYFLALSFAAISLVPFWSGRIAEYRLSLWWAALPILALLLLIFGLTSYGFRRSSPTGKAEPLGDRTPDECWKGGIIYYNPDDPALWVEKRFGIGWTVNLANPRAWMVLGGVLVFGVLVVLLSTVMLK
jgi:uncharacterized membrane protein